MVKPIMVLILENMGHMIIGEYAESVEVMVEITLSGQKEKIKFRRRKIEI